ncbi:MAG: hypothetical protein QXX17_05425 [Conexivisphaerales archaeon]
MQRKMARLVCYPPLSVAVAKNTLLKLCYRLPNQNWFQISSRKVPVKELKRDGSDAPESLVVPLMAQGRCKPTTSVVGSLLQGKNEPLVYYYLSLPLN